MKMCQVEGSHPQSNESAFSIWGMYTSWKSLSTCIHVLIHILILYSDHSNHNQSKSSILLFCTVLFSINALSFSTVNSNDALQSVKYPLQDTKWCSQNRQQRTCHSLKRSRLGYEKEKCLPTTSSCGRKCNSQNYAGQIGSIGTIHSHHASVLWICIGVINKKCSYSFTWIDRWVGK